MIRRKAICTLTSVALVAAALFATTAPAHATNTGGGALQCKAALTVFPGVNASGSCTGSTLLSAHVFVQTPPVPPKKIIVIDPGTFTANFTYSEGCLASEPPLTGTASGTAHVGGATAIDSNNNVTSATLDASFAWTRVGAIAVITTGPWGVTTGTGETATGTAGGAAVGAFVPLPPLGTCASPAPLTAQVVAVAAEAI